MGTTSSGNGVGTTRERRGRVVSSFDTYQEAERAVDRLSDERFPVERVRIVGQGLHFVEEVTGRFTYRDAVLRGALSGGLVGLLIGWLFAVFNWFNPVVAWGWLIFDGLWFGLVLGALLGLLTHSLTGGRRDFSSVPSMKADRYELVVDEEVADEAARILGVGQSGEVQANSAGDARAQARS
jgi:hypothetical protein